ncbi:MAG: hypothetical protein RR988_04105 [Clostridia bacterium]
MLKLNSLLLSGMIFTSIVGFSSACPTNALVLPSTQIERSEKISTFAENGYYSETIYSYAYQKQTTLTHKAIKPKLFVSLVPTVTTGTYSGKVRVWIELSQTLSNGQLGPWVKVPNREVSYTANGSTYSYLANYPITPGTNYRICTQLTSYEVCSVKLGIGMVESD